MLATKSDEVFDGFLLFRMDGFEMTDQTGNRLTVELSRAKTANQSTQIATWKKMIKCKVSEDKNLLKLRMLMFLNLFFFNSNSSFLCHSLNARQNRLERLYLARFFQTSLIFAKRPLYHPVEYQYRNL